jgi:signal transduction histidine kinase
MSAVSFITPAEREIYRDYDRQRRLRLTLRVAPVFGAVLVIIFVGATIFLLVAPPTQQFLYLGYEMLGVCITLFGVGTFAARRNQVNLAAGSVAIASSLAIITVYASWALTQGLDPFILTGFASFDLAIVLVGILGETWMVITTALLMNLFTALLLLFALRPVGLDGLVRGQFPLLLSQGALQEWVFALLLLSVVRAYQQTLQELGDIRIAFERAQQLDDLKNQFITSVNHELRNPIMALQGCVEILYLAGDSMAVEERETLFQQARHAGDDLVALLSSILDARRLDQGADQFIPEAVTVRAALQSAIGLIDPRDGQMLERELHIHMDENVIIWGDPVRLRQIFVNLLSNALKYSPPGTPIEFSATFVAQNDARHRTSKLSERPQVEIVVRDHGLGIPPNQIPLLFNRFTRLPRDLASKVTGNGLGLHLCKLFAESMGGTIWVESTGKEGDGSAFHLRLPRA